MKKSTVKYISSRKSVVGSLILIVTCILVLLPGGSSAQSTDNCGGGSKLRAQGLVTSPIVTGKFTTSGGCAIDAKVAFVPFKIPTFDDLKSLYFDQSKLPKNSSLPASFTGDGIYNIAGDLTVSSTSPIPSGSGTQVIFVNGQLNINQNISYHTTDGLGGLVFVVSGDVLINKDVTQIDGVIIAQGKIYTAVTSGQSSCQTSDVQTNALIINGSLISLISDNPAVFCRKLLNNNNPAEIINAQVKYLVLLRDLMSDTLQRWSEIP